MAGVLAAAASVAHWGAEMLLSHEDDDCFYMAGADGEIVPIAKAGLEEATRERIRSKGRVQSFAGGGEVKLDGQEGGTTRPLFAEPAAPVTSPTDIETIMAMMNDPAAAPSPAVTPFDAVARSHNVGELGEGVPTPFITPPTTKPIDVRGTAGERPEAQLRPMGVVESLLVGQGGKALTPADASALGHNAANVQQIAQLRAPSETDPLPAAPTTDVAASGARAGSSTRRPGAAGTAPDPFDLGAAQDSLKAQDAAQQETARIEAAAAAAKAAALLREQEAQKRFDDETVRVFSERQSQADQMKREIAAGRLDPDRLWNSMDDGRKVGLGVSLFLGGFGAALTGGANQALSIFNKRIDADLDAQQKDMTTKQNLLRDFYAETHDMRSARELARAHMLDGIAASMEADGAKFGGQKALAKAAETSALLSGKAQELRLEYTKAGLENRVKLATIQHLQSEATKNYAQANELRLQKGQNAALSQTLDELAVGTARDPRAIAHLPPEVQGRVVQLGGGKYGIASSTEAAKVSREASTQAGTLADLVARMRRVRDEGRAWTPGKRAAESEELTRLAQIAIKNEAALGTWDKGSAELLGSLVSNPADIFTLDSSVYGKLDSLEKWSNDQLRNTLNSNMLRPQQRSLTPTTAQQAAAR